jgi:2-C-methyl-D-erythritol 4-phosphate cytidylyltransferase
MKSTAIILAAGSGKRFNAKKKKQFAKLYDKPLLYYSLKAFSESNADEIIVVTSRDDIDFVREDIVKKYEFSKVTSIVSGGNERYDSVYSGLKAVSGDICLIHDCARAMIDVELINRCIDETVKYRAVVPTVAPKDTIRMRDGEFGGETIDRSTLCIIQTPQCFYTDLIKSAFEKMYKTDYKSLGITDDAMVVEKFSDTKVRLIEGDYKNIKVTTPEDIMIAKAFLDVENGR